MNTFAIILPTLTITFVGYWVARKSWLSRSECDATAKFVFTYVLPCLLFIGTAKAKIPDDMAWQFLFSYYIVVLGVYVCAILIGKFFFDYNDAEQSVFGMGASYSNATIVGIPICVYSLGEQALLPVFIIISIHNLALFMTGILVAERNTLSLSSFFSDLMVMIRQLLANPITGSLAAGGLVNVLNIPIYLPIEEAISSMSKAAIPAALFVLGTSLNKYKLQGHITSALCMVTLKIVLLPLGVAFLVFHVFTIDPLWAASAVLTSAMPVGVSAYIFSQKYTVIEAPIASAIVISTLASVVTLSVVLSFLPTIN
ncbi:MAG: malonate transporter [Flavobacteriales bacterium]|jgi:malonate transporter